MVTSRTYVWPPVQEGLRSAAGTFRGGPESPAAGSGMPAVPAFLGGDPPDTENSLFGHRVIPDIVAFHSFYSFLDAKTTYNGLYRE